MIDGEVLSPDEREALARSDGFENWPEMASFWGRTHGKEDKCGGYLVDFAGHIIHWQEMRI